MTETMQQILTSFDALPDADKHQVAVEILRRMTFSEESDLSEDTLVGAADELFRVLDIEAVHRAYRKQLS